MFNFFKEKIKNWVKSSVSALKSRTNDSQKSKKPDSSLEEVKEPDDEGKFRNRRFLDEVKKSDSSLEEVEKPDGFSIVQKPQVSGGFFTKIKEKWHSAKIDEEKFISLFSPLELSLMENNVAIEAIDKIKEQLKKKLINSELISPEEQLKSALKESIETLFIAPIDILEKIKQKQGTFIIAFFGINGSGKTTTIAKIAHMLKKNDISCIIAAADTFRAASIEQLQYHCSKIGIPIIKQAYGSDPAAVAFDAIKHAQARKIKVVMIDTAGRMHTKENLMKEMEKICRVSKPDLKIFIAESTVGNDIIEQVRTFDKEIGIDGIIVSKTDADEKGGTAISISYATGEPILFLGTGQDYDDLEVFDKNKLLKKLGL